METQVLHRGISNKEQRLIDEIKETLWMIERDLEPYGLRDSMNYTGYLAENAADLKNLVSKLLGE